MSKAKAQEFFDHLEKDQALRDKIKLGLESLTKIAADYDVTQEELTAELQKRWQCQPGGTKLPYSEPPGL
jgi:hypothetical protein